MRSEKRMGSEQRRRRVRETDLFTFYFDFIVDILSARALAARNLSIISTLFRRITIEIYYASFSFILSVFNPWHFSHAFCHSSFIQWDWINVRMFPSFPLPLARCHVFHCEAAEDRNANAVICWLESGRTAPQRGRGTRELSAKSRTFISPQMNSYLNQLTAWHCIRILIRDTR